MPRNPSPLPLKKVTLLLYEEDLKYLREDHGPGWFERIREAVHQDVLDLKRLEEKYARVNYAGD